MDDLLPCGHVEAGFTDRVWLETGADVSGEQAFVACKVCGRSVHVRFFDWGHTLTSSAMRLQDATQSGESKDKSL